MTVTIRELNDVEGWKKSYPVMKQLRTHLSEEEFLTLVAKAIDKEGYKLTALYEEEKIVAVIGYMPMITLYNGEFIWICDLVTDENQRSNGYGKYLLNYVEVWAKEQGYGIVSLSSGLQRHDAHRFYEEKMNYNRVSYVFLKKI